MEFLVKLIEKSDLNLFIDHKAAFEMDNSLTSLKQFKDMKKISTNID